MEEVAVAPGMRLPLTASHDTYGISFARGPLAAAAGEPESASGADAADSAAKGGSTQASVAPTGVPLQVRLNECTRRLRRLSCASDALNAST